MAGGWSYQFGEFHLDGYGRVLTCGGHTVPLAPKLGAILLLLIENSGNVVGKDELLQKAWAGEFVEEGSLTRTISLLRKIVGKGGSGKEYIVTVPKCGYRFMAPVQKIRERRATPGDDKIMMAVLPFENLSRKKDQEYLSDGLTEEMITQLARLSPERLGVIARTSAMQYRYTKKSVRQIGRELGVSYVLEGSVRRAGHRVRIAAQLIRVSDETYLWAESYERPLGDILALQSDVGRAIANQIPIKLAPLEQARLARKRQISPEAHEAYLRGRYFWNQRTKQALEKSLRYFEKAVEKDPDFALGYTGLADYYSVLASTAYSFSPMEAFSKGAVSARKALQIDETLAEAHTSLAQSNFYALDWLAAEKELRRSIELNPSYATAHHWYALYLAATGRFAEALAEANCACALDPLSVIINRDLGVVYYYARQPDRAIEQFQNTMELDPNFALLHQGLGRAYLEKGMREEAISEIQRAVRLSRRSTAMVATLAHAHAVTGKPQEARKILRDLMARSGRSYVSPTSIAIIFAGLSDKENALEWLEKACNERDPGLHTLKVHPVFDSLRSEPRFRDLVLRMNFPDSGEARGRE